MGPRAGPRRPARRGPPRRVPRQPQRAARSSGEPRTARSPSCPGRPELVVVIGARAAASRRPSTARSQPARRRSSASPPGSASTSDEGRAREQAVVERVRAAGAVLLGPNCLGVFDALAELDIGWSELPAGPIGLVSQSGNLALELRAPRRPTTASASRASPRSATRPTSTPPISSTHLAAHEHDARDRALRRGLPRRPHLRAARARRGRRRQAGRPARRGGAARPAAAPPALTPARSSATSTRRGRLPGRRASSSSRRRSELIDAAQALLAPCRPRGRRVAVFGDGGGHGVIAADLAAAAGLELPGSSELARPPAHGRARPDGGDPKSRRPRRRWRGGSPALRACRGAPPRVRRGRRGVADRLLRRLRRSTAPSTRRARPRSPARWPESPPRPAGRSSPRRCTRCSRLRERSGRKASPSTGISRPPWPPSARLAERRSRRPWACPRLPEPDREPPRGAGYFEARELLAGAGIPFVEARRVRDPRRGSRGGGRSRLPRRAEGARCSSTSPTRAASCSGSGPRRRSSGCWRI